MRERERERERESYVVLCCSDDKDIGCRIVKDTVCFHADNFQQVTDKLLLDLHEPPVSQVTLQCCKLFGFIFGSCSRLSWL